MLPISDVTGSPATNGRSMTSATSGSVVAPSNAASGMPGQASGMYRPPSGARPCASAWPKFTAGDFPRVLMNFMRSTRQNVGARGRDGHDPVVHLHVRGAERRHHRGAHLLGVALERPREHRRARARDRAAERAGFDRTLAY